MNTSYYLESYEAHLHCLRQQHGEARAMEVIVGDHYDAVGALEARVLQTLGLRPGDTVVDVGCGTGRLASQLAKGHPGRFIGIDLLPELVEFARTRANRTDWEFGVACEPPLPVANGLADWVTFFSVFTHLLEEHSYLYLVEAARMLKPGGRIVFSFLDFEVEAHWQYFAGVLADRNPRRVLNRFLNRRAIEVWAVHLGLSVERIMGGDLRWIEPADSNAAGDGNVAAFGQSLAVLSKP